MKIFRDMTVEDLQWSIRVFAISVALFVVYSLGHHAITAWQLVSHTTIQSLTVSVQKPQEVAPVMKALLPPLEVRR